MTAVPRLVEQFERGSQSSDAVVEHLPGLREPGHHPRQRYPVQVVLHGQMGEQSIAEKPLGKNSRRPCGEGAVTVATVTLFQFIANDFLSHRVHFNNGAGLGPLGMQRAAAVRATFWPRH